MAIPESRQIESWVKAARRGDGAAFEMLVRHFQDAVVGVVLARTGPCGDVEDIAQDAFVAAYMQLHDFPDPRRFGAWVCGIARNMALRYLRDRKPTERLPSEGPPPRPGPSSELADEVMHAVGELPERLREPLTLYYINGYTTRQVAGLLELPEGTVRRRLHEARNRLRQKMEVAMEDEIREYSPGADFPGEVTGRLGEGARRTMSLANQEGAHLGQDYIGAEHILIAVLAEGSGLGARTLASLGVDLERLRAIVGDAIQSGARSKKECPPSRQARGKAVIERAVREARYRGAALVGTEHLLVAVLGSGVVRDVLMRLGLSREDVRQKLASLLLSESEKNLAGIREDASVLLLNSDSEADLHLFRSLFAREIPEVAAGAVEVKAVGRETGVLAKVAVWSSKPDMDPVGVCMGKNDERFETIQKEIAPEGVDVIRWHPASKLFVVNAVRPAEAREAIPCPELKEATVVVPEGQVADALGKQGARIRAAARLVGWDLHVVTPREYWGELHALESVLWPIEGAGPSVLDRVIAAGLVSAGAVVRLGAPKLAKALGLDNELAAEMVSACRAIEEHRQGEHSGKSE